MPVDDYQFQSLSNRIGDLQAQTLQTNATIAMSSRSIADAVTSGVTNAVGSIIQTLQTAAQNASGAVGTAALATNNLRHDLSSFMPPLAIGPAPPMPGAAGALIATGGQVATSSLWQDVRAGVLPFSHTPPGFTDVEYQRLARQSLSGRAEAGLVHGAGALAGATAGFGAWQIGEAAGLGMGTTMGWNTGKVLGTSAGKAMLMGTSQAAGIGMAAGVFGATLATGGVLGLYAAAEELVMGSVERYDYNRQMGNIIQQASFRMPGVGDVDPITGAGMSARTARNLGTDVAGMAMRDLTAQMRFGTAGTKELYAETVAFGLQKGLYSDVGEGEGFKKRTQELANAVKELSRQLAMSTDEATTALMRLKREGGRTDEASVRDMAMRTRALARTGGFTTAEVMSAGDVGAEMFLGTGISAEAGRAAMTNTMAASTMMLQSGRITDAQMADVGGRAGLGKIMAQRTLDFTQSGLGRTVLFGMVGPGGDPTRMNIGEIDVQSVAEKASFMASMNPWDVAAFGMEASSKWAKMDAGQQTVMMAESKMNLAKRILTANNQPITDRNIRIALDQQGVHSEAERAAIMTARPAYELQKYETSREKKMRDLDEDEYESKFTTQLERGWRNQVSGRFAVVSDWGARRWEGAGESISRTVGGWFTRDETQAIRQQRVAMGASRSELASQAAISRGPLDDDKLQDAAEAVSEALFDNTTGQNMAFVQQNAMLIARSRGTGERAEDARRELRAAVNAAEKAGTIRPEDSTIFSRTHEAFFKRVSGKEGLAINALVEQGGAAARETIKKSVKGSLKEALEYEGEVADKTSGARTALLKKIGVAMESDNFAQAMDDLASGMSESDVNMLGAMARSGNVGESGIATAVQALRKDKSAGPALQRAQMDALANIVDPEKRKAAEAEIKKAELDKTNAAAKGVVDIKNADTRVTVAAINNVAYILSKMASKQGVGGIPTMEGFA